MLREALAAGFTTVELIAPPDDMPMARAQSEGSWKSFMAFPEAVYGKLIEYLKEMAGVAAEDREADATIHVQVAGRDAAVELHLRRNAQSKDEIVLQFPAATAA